VGGEGEEEAGGEGEVEPGREGAARWVAACRSRTALAWWCGVSHRRQQVRTDLRHGEDLSAQPDPAARRVPPVIFHLWRGIMGSV
jgi:hypothetical protein